MCFLKLAFHSDLQQKMPLISGIFMRPMTIRSPTTGYIQSSRATMRY